MRLKELFKMQRELDTKIKKKHNVNEDLFNKKILSFYAEVGELANEIRFFKYWSNKKASPTNIILEEYVDALHFIISLGLEIRADNYMEEDIHIECSTLPTLEEEFIHIYRLTAEFSFHNSLSNYYKLFNRYMSLGHILGFDEERIIKGYILKNNINHQRQDQGY